MMFVVYIYPDIILSLPSSRTPKVRQSETDRESDLVFIPSIIRYVI